ncbi:Ger(x)C family spore germination protein [Pontibacillus sp. HMF3514]|uniref:Ger(x)C family spore germination protein n=1 Tax=Pontibacillus sp. HMF3514 TaxID=2692425 RepID=UPI00131FC016|nr:Ger(x)C family spore germination protein [Pontibacillus sp. HMF3514]QHE51257.1 Ger(x)C family spore germination protein [Pontibacillus sp. HMF3514]
MIRYSAITLLLLILLGCTNTGSEELNIQAIVTAIGFDKAEDDKVSVHFQVVYPGGSTQRQGSAPQGGSGNAVYTYTITAESMIETVDKARNLLPRKLFFPHIQMIVFGEEFARDVGFSYMVDYMERDNEVRDEIMVFTAKNDTAKNIMSVYTSLTANPSEGTINRVQNTYSPMGLKDGIYLEDIIQWAYGHHHDPVTMGISRSNPDAQASNDEALKNIHANQNAYDLTGIPLYKKDKLVDWYTIKESKGWALLQDRVKETLIITANCPNEEEKKFGLLLKDIKTKKDAKVNGSQVTITVALDGRGILREVNCKGKINDPKYLTKLRDTINSQMVSYIHMAIEKSKENEVDSFGFGQYLYRHKPKDWKRIQEDWYTIYTSSLKVDATSNIELSGVGTRRRSVHEPDQQNK